MTPVITWTVAGRTLTVGTGGVDVSAAEGTFTIQYELTADPNELTLIGRGGERYNAPITATATEPHGEFEHRANDSFDPIGWTTGFSAQDLAKLDDCITRKLQRVFIRKFDWILPPLEDDGLNRLHDRINQVRLDKIVHWMTDVYPLEAAELGELAQMRARQLGSRLGQSMSTNDLQ